MTKTQTFKFVFSSLVLTGISYNGIAQNSDSTLTTWAVKTSVARYLRGDYAIQIERRLFGHHAIDLGAGITRPFRADIPDRFSGEFSPRTGWSAQGSYRTYLGKSQKFSVEVMYRYQLYNAEIEGFKTESNLSKEGLETNYHHYSLLFSYQIIKNKSLYRFYTGLGYYKRTKFSLFETVETELDPSVNRFYTTYEHTQHKVELYNPSWKIGIEIGIGW